MYRRVTSRGFAAIVCFPLALSLSSGDYGRLDAGEAVVQVLPESGPNVALRAATRSNVDGERLVAWTHHLERLQSGPYQAAAGRFSDPPCLDDLSELFLEDDDLMDLRRCRPGDCGLKLDADEITEMRAAMASAASNWKAAAHHTFRTIVLARLERYRAQGHGTSASYHDQKSPVSLNREFMALANDFAARQPHFRWLTSYLADYPHVDAQDVESFFYWSKDSLGARPIISVTHVAILGSGNPSLPEAVVARKQVYASHYINASLSVTAISMAPSGEHRYIIYLNHTRADVFGGMFGGLIRKTIERRLRREGPRALDVLRRRLESGIPD